ncbi:tetratricopeptide repeat protein [Micromonospora sp. NPDC048930]|uniref:tetratricopeptide repeat protein n=1 Tax=Micromonospora sp. NPDC048930 TaxID=3364261 RepID=UPI00371A500E
MKWRWSQGSYENQSISDSTVSGHVFQISGTSGDVSIHADWPAADLTNPGNLSIVPPTDHLGRPIHGRHELLSELLRSVDDDDKPGDVKVLFGLGGCGKSTIAMLLSDQARRRGMDVWWISAASRNTLHDGMRQLSSALGAPQGRLIRAWSGQESATDLLWELLNRHEKKWLLVVDGADDPLMLAADNAPLSDGNGWIRPPLQSQGSIVVTTRDNNARRWAPWCNLQPVNMLSPADSATVLMDYAGGLAGSRPEAEKLATRLGCLPLALRLAGTHIEANTKVPWPDAITSYAGYLRALEAEIAELFPELDEDSSTFGDRQARELVGCTWELSLSALEKRGISQARRLLQMLSHFADSPVPVDLLEPQVLDHFGVFEAPTKRSLRASIEALSDLGLIDIRIPQHLPDQAEAPAASLAIHPLVRDVGRYPGRLRKPQSIYLAAATVMVANGTSKAPQDDWTSWPRWEALSNHAFYLLSEALQATDGRADVIDAAAFGAYQSARFLMSRGEFERAQIEQIRVLEALRRIGKEGHPNSLTVRHDLAVSLGRLGRLSEAELELRTVQEQKSRIFGPTSPETLATIHAHADVLWQLGELARAEGEYRLILSVKDRGPSYRNVLGTRNNLYQVLMEQGKLPEAVAEIDGFVHDAETKGVGGTAIAQARFVRARIRKAQARFDEAISEFREVADHHSATLGESHPITLSTKHELGVALQESGDAAAACHVLRSVFLARSKMQGSDHPETLATRHQFALALQEAGEREEAQAHYRATLKRRSKVLGERHPHTLATRFQLAVLLEESGDLKNAEEEFLNVLIDECSTIGADHPSTLTTRVRLVNYMVLRQQWPRAFEELERILSARRRIYGNDHPIPRDTEQMIAFLKANISS